MKCSGFRLWSCVTKCFFKPLIWNSGIEQKTKNKNKHTS
uniref:Uncharacterized protein n=1 Tax=Anguilla anguilla TaxID=7936 RepID=A0A0E9QR42_ANGAN